MNSNFQNIDSALTGRNQWVCHSDNKIPLQPNGRSAKSNDRSTWSSFQEVVEAVTDGHSTNITGIGYVFTKDDPFIGIDLDDCFENGDLKSAAQEIVDWANSYTEKSVSGNGLHIIVKGILPDGFPNKISMEHVGFKCIEIYDSLRYFTMTGDIYRDQKPIRAVNIQDLEIPTTTGRSSSKKRAISSPKHDYLLSQIKDSDDGPLFSALHDHGDLTRYDGDKSRAELGYISLLAKWTKFDAELTDQLYRQSALMRSKWDEKHRSDGTTYGEMTIRKAFEGKSISGSDEHEGFLSYFYDFRFNVVTNRTEVKVEGNWKLMYDYQFNSVLRDMRNRGAKISQRRLQSLLQSDFVEKYHPFHEYFDNLPKWDGTDWIEKLAGQVKTKDQPYWEWCLRKWLVALVASVKEEEVVNQTVLILQGGQGVGKSTFLLGLAPEELTDYVFSGNLNPNNKDSIIQLSETIICQLDELETLTKYKEGALKELITKSEIRVRRPYARYADKLTRFASLCGSINQGTMLHDPTGSRRFLIHQVYDINYQHNIDMTKVYGQALHLYKEGFKYWFDGKEIQRINRHNKQFETQSVEEELLLEHFEKAEKGDRQAKRYTATQILEKLHGGQLPSSSHRAVTRLGQALSKHGYQSVKSQGSKYYLVNKKDSFESTFMAPSSEDGEGEPGSG